MRRNWTNIWRSGQPGIRPRRSSTGFRGPGYPSGIVATARDLARDPQLRARGYFREIGHPLSGNITTDRCPIRFMDDTQGPWQPSPLLGEHNAYVYKELLGLSEDKFNFYVKERVIF